MKEIEIDKLLAYELAEGDLGTEHSFKGFAARIAENPLADSFEELASPERMESVRFYKRFSIWIVPHRLSIVRRKGFSEPVSVGIEVEYLNGPKTCSIISLFPSFEFYTVGNVGVSFSADADLGGNLKVAKGDGLSGSEKNLGQLSVGIGAAGNVGLSLSCKVFTPKVMAVGIGSCRCEWRFDVADSPLYGRDLETWSLVALPKSQKRLAYRMRFYVVTRFAFVPQRFESAWEEVECQLASKVSPASASPPRSV
jgi:hypothetical protein